MGETWGNGSTELGIDLLLAVDLAGGKLATDGKAIGEAELAILGKGEAGTLRTVSIGAELLGGILPGDCGKVVAVGIAAFSSD